MAGTCWGPCVAAESRPAWSTWGRWGDDDEIGTLNLQTAIRVRDAARLVRHGVVLPLNWSLELPDPPLLGRGASRHTVDVDDLGIADDHLDAFYPQRSSQWDALAHVRHPTHGLYNGWSTRSSGRRPLTIDRVAERGIAGRFVLADVARFRALAGRPIDCSASESVTGEELDDVLAAQGTSVEDGDVLLIRFGWTAWYERLDAARRATFGSGQFSAPGIAGGRETAEWIAARQFAAVAADVPALEVMPIDLTADGFLHYRLIALLGLTIGELFDLRRLGSEAARLSTWEGMLVAAPWNQPGGMGSPANAIALL